MTIMKPGRLLVLLGLLAGCAGQPPQQEPLQPLVFPPPPDEPRFVYERTVRSSADIAVADSGAQWRALLTGESATGTGFGKPFDISVCQGQIFVTDTVRRSIMAFDVPERRFFEFGTEDPGAVRKPLGVATDDQCNVYVADGTNRTVMIFNQNGAFISAVGGLDMFERLSHVAVDAAGTKVFAVDIGGVDTAHHRIRVFDVASGEHLYDIGTRGEDDGQFNLPRDIEMGADGLLYVVDGGNFRVQVLDQKGTFIRKFGRLGRMYGQFSRPKGIGIDATGNVYVSDTAFGNFQIFDPEGQLLLFVGSRSEKFERATFMLPAGLAVDEDGRVYMVDQFFRKFDVFRPADMAPQEGFLGAWNLPGK